MDPLKSKEMLNKIPPMPESMNKTEVQKRPEDKTFEEIFARPLEIKDKDGKVHVLPVLVCDKEWELTHKAYKLIQKAKITDWTSIIENIMDCPGGKEDAFDILSILMGLPAKEIGNNFTWVGIKRLFDSFFVPVVAQKQMASVNVNSIVRENISNRMSSLKN